MSSPLGHLLADIFTGYLEKHKLNGKINSICFCRRYVDDISAVLKTGHELPNILHKFNKVHVNIHFMTDW